jgi:hypothetical protein
MPASIDTPWRNVNGHRQFCHSWRLLGERRVSAMTIVWIALALAATAWLVARLVVTVRHDGRGTRPPPASHLDWSDSTSGLPSRPYGATR